MNDSSKSFRASNLEGWEIQAAKNLKAIFEKANISQKMFGQTWGIGTGGMMSQYLNGKRPLRLPAAIKFAKGLKVSVSEISPTLAAQLPQSDACTQEEALKQPQPFAMPALSSTAQLEDALRILAVALAQADASDRNAAKAYLSELCDKPGDVDTLSAKLNRTLTPLPLQANGKQH